MVTLLEKLASSYKVEFPDYDEVLPEFPGMVDDSWGAGDAMPMFCNEAVGIRLWCDYRELAKSAPEVQALRLSGDAKRFTLKSVVDKVQVNDDLLIVASDSIDEVLDAYADAWMRRVSVEIGIGFHPDTPAAEYDPPLRACVSEQYDEMVTFSHERLEDVYAVSLDAWEKAGIIEFTP